MLLYGGFGASAGSSPAAAISSGDWLRRIGSLRLALVPLSREISPQAHAWGLVRYQAFFVNLGGSHEKGASPALHWYFLLRHILRRSAAGVLSAPSADSDGLPVPPAPGGGAAPVSVPGLCRRCGATSVFPSKKEEAVISHGSPRGVLKMSLDAFLSDLQLAVWIVGIGFLFRFGMYGFDNLVSLLAEHSRKKKP